MTSDDKINGLAISQISELVQQLDRLDWKNEAEKSAVNARRLLRLYQGAESDWQKYIRGEETGYDRCLIHTGPKFQMLLLRFKPLKANLPHDHGGVECLFKVLDGRLIEKQFAKPTSVGPLQWKCIQQYEANEVNCSPDIGFCHCCGNPSTTEEAVSLVLY
ncbi:hypothetical protein Btru_032713 [Bulinus truncatus]|nr:hypothetical protein Btru_032713 [Bulinus truncatus]